MSISNIVARGSNLSLCTFPNDVAVRGNLNVGGQPVLTPAKVIAGNNVSIQNNNGAITISATGGGGGGSSQTLAQVLQTGNNANNQSIQGVNSLQFASNGKLSYPGNAGHLQFDNGSGTTQNIAYLSEIQTYTAGSNISVNNNAISLNDSIDIGSISADSGKIDTTLQIGQATISNSGANINVNLGSTTETLAYTSQLPMTPPLQSVCDAGNAVSGPGINFCPPSGVQDGVFFKSYNAGILNIEPPAGSTNPNITVELTGQLSAGSVFLQAGALDIYSSTGSNRISVAQGTNTETVAYLSDINTSPGSQNLQSVLTVGNSANNQAITALSSIQLANGSNNVQLIQDPNNASQLDVQGALYVQNGYIQIDQAPDATPTTQNKSFVLFGRTPFQGQIYYDATQGFNFLNGANQLLNVGDNNALTFGNSGMGSPSIQITGIPAGGAPGPLTGTVYDTVFNPLPTNVPIPTVYHQNITGDLTLTKADFFKYHLITGAAGISYSVILPSDTSMQIGSYVDIAFGQSSMSSTIFIKTAVGTTLATLSNSNQLTRVILGNIVGSNVYYQTDSNISPTSTTVSDIADPTDATNLDAQVQASPKHTTTSFRIRSSTALHNYSIPATLEGHAVRFKIAIDSEPVRINNIAFAPSESPEFVFTNSAWEI
jgi:hypothetical protein